MFGYHLTKSILNFFFLVAGKFTWTLVTNPIILGSPPNIIHLQQMSGILRSVALSKNIPCLKDCLGYGPVNDTAVRNAGNGSNMEGRKTWAQAPVREFQSFYISRVFHRVTWLSNLKSNLQKLLNLPFDISQKLCKLCSSSLWPRTSKVFRLPTERPLRIWAYVTDKSWRNVI